ncbi:MAG: ABC transporter permease, partial [Anaeroplasmataceae bacterium]|nr:ABC transporter permease [Anaeroplasmataceae bacterium]
MLKYILKRLFISIFVLLGVSLIIYVLVRMMPGDYIEDKYRTQLDTGTISYEQVHQFKVFYGLDDNSFLGIIKGYFKWLGNFFKGDLGESFKYEKPVAEVISSNMWISFSIALIATILQFLIAIPLGITSATHQYSVRDYTVTVLTMIGISLPTYFFAAIMIKFFAVQLHWFPTSGLVNSSVIYPKTFAGGWARFWDMAHHLFLPIFVSVILSIGGLMRYTRTNTLEVLNADYIRTARAKGLSEKKVVYVHAFRNTMIPLVTLLAGILPSLFGGMMITE